MNIIEISGNEAIQMFQYSFFLAMRERDPRTLLHPLRRDWVASRFGLRQYSLASAEQLKPYGMQSSISRFLAGGMLKPKGKIVEEPADGSFDPNAFKATNSYLRGNRLSPRYFDSVSDKVRQAFWVSDELLPATLHQLIEKLHQPNCVAMLIADGATTDYYNWAIASAMMALGSPRFVVLAPNSQWVTDNLNFQGAPSEVVDCRQWAGHELIACLQRASHIIIGPSLNAWWGAYLNSDPDALIIAPQGWSKKHPLPDLLPLQWTTIPLT